LIQIQKQKLDEMKLDTNTETYASALIQIQKQPTHVSVFHFGACLDSWKWEENGKWENSFPTSLVCFEPKMRNGKISFPFTFFLLHLTFTLSSFHF